MAKFLTADEAVKLIEDGDTISTCGFVGCVVPEELEIALEERFLKTGSPKKLNLVYPCGQGDSKDKGLNHLAHEGLLKRVVGGHWNLAPKLQKMANDNLIEAYNFPQGSLSQLYREIAAHRPGVITKVGLKTFVDPRLQGGKLNEITKEDLVFLIDIMGEEYLLYKSMPINVCLVRGSFADENGNISLEREAAYVEVQEMCQATYNSGGKVIVQVSKVVQNGALSARDVRIPGCWVHAVVEVKDQANHMMTFGEQSNDAYLGVKRVPVAAVKPLEMNERKLIARRCAMELRPNIIINLGIGVPEGVAVVANEEGIRGLMLSVESGHYGGIPAGGLSFGAVTNTECIVSQANQFDFYDGGGLDCTILGLAQCNNKGDINVSKFGPRIAGAGGFIDISQNSKKVVFCGTFTAGGLEVDVKDGKLVIVREGKSKKFVNEVEQVTYSGEYGAEIKQEVFYVTERAVFQLTEKGIVLIEIAPGVDLEKDVLGQMEFKPAISPQLKQMDERIFRPEIMGIGK